MIKTFEYPEVNRKKIYKKLEEYSRGWHINNKDLIPWDDVIKVVDKLIDDNNELIAEYTEEMAMRKSLEFELFKMTKPFKFEDLEEDMFVIDIAFRKIIQIKNIDRSTTRIDFIDHNMEEALTYFQNGRFYPVNILNVGG